jgi:hypothetical protein
MIYTAAQLSSDISSFTNAKKSHEGMEVLREFQFFVDSKILESFDLFWLYKNNLVINNNSICREFLLVRAFNIAKKLVNCKNHLQADIAERL